MTRRYSNFDMAWLQGPSPSERRTARRWLGATLLIFGLLALSLAPSVAVHVCTVEETPQ